MKKILNNTAAIAIGMIIGMVCTYLLFNWMLQPKELTYENGYDRGYNQAQQECRDFIKNTKP